MMQPNDIETATREQLADELGAAGEYTQDWETAELDDLRDRVRNLVAGRAAVSTAAQSYIVLNVTRNTYGVGLTLAEATRNAGARAKDRVVKYRCDGDDRPRVDAYGGITHSATSELVSLA